jgi:hypothetical protein
VAFFVYLDGSPGVTTPDLHHVRGHHSAKVRGSPMTRRWPRASNGIPDHGCFAVRWRS